MLAIFPAESQLPFGDSVGSSSGSFKTALTASKILRFSVPTTLAKPASTA